MNKTKTTTKSSKAETTFVVLLLDRTGSMESVKQETIGGFNGYLDELLKKPESKDIRMTFTQFDSIAVETISDCVALKDVPRLTGETYKPRASTPLYDAIGKTIRATEPQASGKKVLFVTLTDGEENASSEWNQDSIKTLIKEKEDKDKWTFSYIGVGPEAWAANERLAKGTMGASNVLRATRGKNTQKAYAFAAQGTLMRCHTAGGQSVQNLYQGKQLDTE